MRPFAPALRPKLIYIFAPRDPRHAGCLKIAEAPLDDDFGHPLPPPNSPSLRQAAQRRIELHASACGIECQLLHAEIALHIRRGTTRTLRDHDIHRALQHARIPQRELGASRGWYQCDLQTARRAIADAKAGLPESEATPPPITLRPEQREAIDRTKRRFHKGKRMLWNAKMRFGKTLCALHLVREMGLTRTLLLTHRPVVNQGWLDEFSATFAQHPHYRYGSKLEGSPFEALERHAEAGGKYIYFVSMQDMRGSAEVGGLFDKNADILSAPWDLVIVDEAHEGTQTPLGQAVLRQVIGPRTRLLQLSGTPFNLLETLKPEEVYTWDYIMEQRAKAQWDAHRQGEPNPYADLPAIRIYTYDLGTLLAPYAHSEWVFNFREFFRTLTDGTFAHGADIDRFLDLLTADDSQGLYPYANETLRGIFRHTLWILPGVAEAKALRAKLRAHPVLSAFEIVNVAGDGDEEISRVNALQLVHQAIGPDPDATRTITLSCGRLTTGVTVRPWTGVLLLAGSHSASAAGYMQTIFRVQSPYTYNGRTKTLCYVFDFAPDRTLRVFAQALRAAPSPHADGENDRQHLDDHLAFCPIIAIRGGQMRPYSAQSLLAQLKRLQIDRVMMRGFDDPALYTPDLLALTPEDISEFEALRAQIGRIKPLPRPAHITLNQQGLTGEASDSTPSPDGQPQPSGSALAQEMRRRRQIQQHAIDILRGISIRIPLLLYGAQIANEDEDLAIGRFTQLVDDASWGEFMPRGVTKERFARFARYYDPDIFREAGKRIRSLVREADQCPIEERIARIAAIFATFRNPDKETVLTPWRVVNMHLAEALGGYCFWDADYARPLETPRRVEQPGITDRVFTPQRRILEINAKSGLYPLYAAYSIYRARLEEAQCACGHIPHSERLALWDRTLEENILALCKTPMARYITRRTLAGFRDVSVHAEVYPNLIPNLIKNPKQVARNILSVRRFWFSNHKHPMTIDAIIGNPPYQVANVGQGHGADPLYHLFLDLATSLAPLCTLIHPARFLFNVGKTPKEWNRKMLDDPHFQVVHYIANGVEVFPSVEIKGGVAISRWDRERPQQPIDFFTPHPELRTIATKVANHDVPAISTIMSPREHYRLTEQVYQDHPALLGRQSAGHTYSFGVNIFALFPELFLDSPPSGKQREMVRVYGRLDNQRCYKWINANYISKPPGMEEYRVFIPKTSGKGELGEPLSSPIVGEPHLAHTDTFLSIGPFSTRDEAEACLRYVKSKFARLLLGILKVTHDNPKETWARVPLQDFTAGSDIDWSQPVADIDQQLYRKYGLSSEEIAFIERTVRPMA